MRFSQGDPVLYGGRKVVIDAGAGGGDYVVRTKDGERFAVTERELAPDPEAAAPAAPTALTHDGGTASSAESSGRTEETSSPSDGAAAPGADEPSDTGAPA